MNEVIIYTTEDEQSQVDVRFEEDTVWLTQAQMAELFQHTKQNISLHIGNCFREGELEPSSVVKESLTAAADGKKYRTKFFNLDVIISVGYRVKSRRGTQFRQWATTRLREYLVEGYAINQRRLEERNIELLRLKDGIRILHRAIEQEARSLADAASLATLLDRFAAGLTLLDDYDRQELDSDGRTKRAAVRIGADEYRSLISSMEDSFASSVFGREKDEGFDSALGQIYQSFDGAELYPTLEEKAATLFYLVVKNHAFVDGNKRIAAACFLYFLERNGLLSLPGGGERLDNDALAALTLFIAVSRPEEMDTVKKVLISVLNRKGGI
ncbi:MAG TPA: RhuM family protein [Rectinemataceae bacterium]|nr:RhuM family protein [Rectinemataceae bacterium]